MMLRFFLVFIMIFSPLVLRAQQPAAPEILGFYIPYHIYNTQLKEWIDLETLLADIKQDDVVFLGEQHNDQYAHHLQLAILEGIARRRPNTVLAMEMFERDVQPMLNSYVTGQISEREFLAQSRPWPNYITDYRPLVEFARSQGWQVVGSNAPHRLARAVSIQGIDVVEHLSTSDRKLIAAGQFDCPHDDYWQRFAKVMASFGSAHGIGFPNPHATSAEGEQPPNISNRVEQLYQAECVKDETMAESIATIIKEKEPTKPLVIHVNGDFHSAFGEGAAARAHRRLPNARIQNISIIPIPDLDKIAVNEYIKQGNYLVFTLGEEEQ